MQVTVFDKDGRGKAGKHYRVSGTFVEEIIKKKKKKNHSAETQLKVLACNMWSRADWRKQGEL